MCVRGKGVHCGSLCVWERELMFEWWSIWHLILSHISTSLYSSCLLCVTGVMYGEYLYQQECTNQMWQDLSDRSLFDLTWYAFIKRMKVVVLPSRLDRFCQADFCAMLVSARQVFFPLSIIILYSVYKYANMLYECNTGLLLLFCYFFESCLQGFCPYSELRYILTPLKH